MEKLSANDNYGWYRSEAKVAAVCRRSSGGGGKGACLEEASGSKDRKVECCDAEVTRLDPARLERFRVSGPCPKPRVVIVGAGLAGLSAAHRLLSLGIDNVVICEAKPRPGGRIHSCKLGGSVVELGAEYIEGASLANPVCNLAGLEGLLDQPLQRQAGSISEDKFGSGGLILIADDKPFSSIRGGSGGASESYQRAKKLINKIERQASELYRKTTNAGFTTLGQFFNSTMEKEMEYYFTGEDKKTAYSLVDGALGELRVRWGVSDLSQLSATQYGSYLDIPGGRLRLPLGATGLLAPLLRTIPQSALKYNKMVQTIEWWPNHYGSRANVKCCDGEELPADFVIVTVSLGVLKSQANRLFCPRLPPEKMQAIEKLGFGHVDKIFLEYSRPFWSSEAARTIHLAYSDGREQNPADREDDDWLRGVGVVEVGPERTLGVNVAGRKASLALAARSDRDAAEEFTNLLRRATDDPSLPNPINVLRSRWSTDVCFLGARSYLCPGSTVEDQCRLAAPLPPTPAPVLLFAGEASAPAHFGTLHGARITGVREADRIVALTLAHGGPPP